MDDRRLGMVVRARRHARGWRLVDLASAAGVSSGTCSLLERGKVARLSVRTARAVADALELPLGWDIGWQRQEVDRLLDADHSALAARLVRLLNGRGWTCRVEASFNRYGDRGRIDVLAFHPGRGVVLVIEIKTRLVDVQQMLGALDVKARVAPIVARDLGWQPRETVPVLVLLDSTTSRRRLAEVAPLFSRFAVRGHAARRWLSDPMAGVSGLLILAKLPDGNGSDRRRAGRRRMRLKGAGRGHPLGLTATLITRWRLRGRPGA